MKKRNAMKKRSQVVESNESEESKTTRLTKRQERALKRKVREEESTKSEQEKKKKTITCGQEQKEQPKATKRQKKKNLDENDEEEEQQKEQHKATKRQKKKKLDENDEEEEEQKEQHKATKRQKKKKLDENDEEEEEQEKEEENEHQKATKRQKKKKLDEKDEEEQEDEENKKKKKIEESDELQKKSKNQFRSTWPYLDQFRDILDEEALGQLRSSPLRDIFEVFYESKLDKAYFSKSNKLVAMMADKYDAKTKSFLVGGSRFKISDEHTAAIFGLHNLERSIDEEQEDVESIKKLFGTERVNKKKVITALDKLREEEAETEEDQRKKTANLVRLVILEICINFLFANGGGNASQSLVSSIWSNVNQFHWAANVNNFLATCLKARLQSKGASMNTGGCAHLILVQKFLHNFVSVGE